MDSLHKLFQFVFKVIILSQLSAAQLTMQELKHYEIDPLNLNGTEPYTDLTIDQIIMRASGGSGVAQNMVLGENGTVLAELDMRLTQEQFNNLYEQPQNMEQPSLRAKRATKRRSSVLRRNKRKAISDQILRWPRGIIPYKFVNGHFEEKEQYVIRSAMTEWEKYTCLRFKLADKSDNSLVRFQNGAGCNSQLGMVRGQQPLNLDKNGCRFKGLYLHEIGHAIGLVHEHQLPNRDEYIDILQHNVQPDMRIWFNKYSSQEVDQMKVPYEFSSVMHYGITAFSADGKSQTIKAKQKFADMEKTIGRVYRKELSFTDVKIVNLMYECAKHCEKGIICRDEGYVDQNCKCICRDGSDACTKSQAAPTDATCFNAHDNWQCNVWANQGECDRNPRFMLDGCKKACRLCGGEGETRDACKDIYNSTKCQIWKNNGECIVNKKWMAKNCKSTCKACKDLEPDPDVSCTNEHINLTECEKWAAEGECQINPKWMPSNCRMSCHMCGQSDSPVTTPAPDSTKTPGLCEDIHNTIECKGWADSDECDLNPDWMIPNCRKSCNKCSGSSDNKTQCKNTWDDKQCEGWARDQECLKNSGWMNTNCHRACTKCVPDGSTTTPTSKTQTTKTSDTTHVFGSCVNNHKNEQECQTWAQHGHCKINKWMTIHCAKSCQLCGDQVQSTTTPKPDISKDSVCVDQEKHCGAWAAHGFCEDNPATALRICKKSCKSCNSNSADCYDKNQLCSVWSLGGQCQRNGGYMLRNCQKSCRVC